MPIYPVSWSEALSWFIARLHDVIATTRAAVAVRPTSQILCKFIETELICMADLILDKFTRKGEINILSLMISFCLSD